jgi:hypothetical protein
MVVIVIVAGGMSTSVDAPIIGRVGDGTKVVIIGSMDGIRSNYRRYRLSSWYQDTLGFNGWPQWSRSKPSNWHVLATTTSAV